jgi:hypothetical protein
VRGSKARGEIKVIRFGLCDPKIELCDPKIKLCDPKIKLCDPKIELCDPKIEPPLFCSHVPEEKLNTKSS